MTNGRKQSGEGLEQLMIKAHSIICETWISVIMSCMASVALGYCCLVMMRQKTEVFSDDETEVFSDDETEDRSV